MITSDLSKLRALYPSGATAIRQIIRDSGCLNVMCSSCPLCAYTKHKYSIRSADYSGSPDRIDINAYYEYLIALIYGSELFS